MADPALVFHDKADRPGTHVLLIGIGDYPWLEGGKKCTTDKHRENALGMGQLTAPPISMRMLADWFLDEFANEDRPLASLAMLLSEKDPALYAHPKAIAPAKKLPRGTIGDVEKAVAQWVGRATRRGDNLIFGFCGHGVQSSDSVLMCRDYGENIENRFQGSIAFERFRIALSTRQPDTQLLFVDACRTPDVANELLEADAPGNPLLAKVSLQTRDNTAAMQSVNFATSLFTEAWGRDDGPSLFSEALLEALAGGGADRNDQWWVTTIQLHAALSTYLPRIAREAQIVQRPTVGQLDNFRISKPPKISVPLYVRSSREPAVWREKMRLEARRGDLCAQGIDYIPPAPEPGKEFSECALRLNNPSQSFDDVVYAVHALFDPASPYLDCSEKIIAYPPEVTCELPVSKRP